MMKTISLALALAFSMHVSAQEKPRIKSTLVATEREGCIWLRVTDRNPTQSVVYLPPDEPLVTITDSKGQEIRFIGIQANKPPLELGDYIVLQPGESHSREVILNPLYALRDPGSYTVSLSGNYLDPIADKIYKWPAVQTTFHFGGQCRR
jgi:hypothetical protein